MVRIRFAMSLRIARITGVSPVFLLGRHGRDGRDTRKLTSSLRTMCSADRFRQRRDRSPMRYLQFLAAICLPSLLMTAIAAAGDGPVDWESALADYHSASGDATRLREWAG